MENHNKRKLAEILHQDYYYQVLYENSMDGILLTCPDGKILSANPAACHMLGYTENEICSLGRAGIVDCDDPRLMTALEERKRMGEFKGEVTFIRKDGTKFLANISSKVFLNNGQSFTSMVIRDVSSSLEIQNKAYEHELICRTMTEASPLAYFVVDNRTDEIIYFNSLFCDIWGIKHLENGMRSRNLKNNDIIPDCLSLVADVSAFVESCKPLQDENNYSVVEDEIAFTDGRIIRRFSSQIRDDDNNYFGRLYIFEDISYRKQMELALRESEKKYRQVFHNSPTIKLIFDAEKGDIIDFNQAALDFYGFSENELKVMKIYDITGAEPRTTLGYIQEVEKKGSKFFLLKHKLSSGEIRDVEVNAALANIMGKKHISCIIFDVTDKKRIEEELREMEQRLKEFAQAVPDASFIVDEDGRHLEIFGDHQKLVPIPKEHLIGRTIQEIMPGESADILLNEIKRSISTNKPQYRVDERKIGENSIWIEGRVVPMSYLVNGKKTAAVVLTDITQQRKTEKMLHFNYELGRKSDFFNDIIGGKVAINEKSKVMAKVWGVDFRVPLICCLLSLKKPINKNGMKEIQNENLMNAQIQKRDVIKLLSILPECTVWESRGNIGILSHNLMVNNDNKKGSKIVSVIKEKVCSYEPNLLVSIGVSNVNLGPESITISYQEAESALIAIQCEGETNERVCYFQDLGLFQLLSNVHGYKYARNYINKMIGPLIAYDMEKGTDLLKTLEEILHNTNLTETAEKMFLHRKTIVFRKKRIEKILGISLDEFETRLAIAAAIKLHKLKSLYSD